MTLDHKIDFAALISVTNANSNGDPLNGNRPRTDYDGYGEISDVCLKRKIRNRMQDLGQPIFVQSDDRCDDGAISLKKRAEKAGLNTIDTQEKFSKAACEKWLDVRTFGQVFPFGENDKNSNKKSAKKKDTESSFICQSVGVRGPVSLHQAVSLDPVEIIDMQITKSVSGDRKNESERGSDTMGMKHFVRFGLYELKGSINVQLAEKTGFTQEDAEIVKECLRTLFVNDASSARPDGSMEVVRLFWWEHSCKDGQYSSAKVHRTLKAHLKDGVAEPRCADDYIIELDELPGLKCEVIEGQ